LGRFDFGLRELDLKFGYLLGVFIVLTDISKKSRYAHHPSRLI
jgi:hypothetical protein